MDPLSLKVAYGYVRESTDDQLEFSPEAQRKALYKYAEQHGYILDEQNIFVDEGISGRKAQKRPEFQRMIAKAKSQEPATTYWYSSAFQPGGASSYKSMLKTLSGEHNGAV